jgi:hypothetical protein
MPIALFMSLRLLVASLGSASDPMPVPNIKGVVENADISLSSLAS